MNIDAYANVDRQLAQKLIKHQNIRKVEEVYRAFCSLAHVVREIREDKIVIFLCPQNLSGDSISEVLENTDR